MKINENSFLKHLRRHDENALLYVIDTYGGLLHSIVRKHLYSLPDRQEECLNDIFLAIWENIEQFDEDRSSFKNWIAGISRFKSLDYLRKYLKDHDNISLEDSGLEFSMMEQTDSAAAILNQELSEELEMMLSCLKPMDRELFLKVFYEEKDLDEISQETGIKKDVLYNHISRGKKRIRKHYENVKGVGL